MSRARVTTAAAMCVAVAGLPVLVAQPASSTAVQAEVPAAVPGAAVRTAVAKGSLGIRLTGLPAGARTTVTIYGPNQSTGRPYPAYRTRLSAPGTLNGLRPGLYGVSAGAVTTAAGRAIPQRAFQTLTLKARTTTTVNIGYLFAPAAAPTGLSVVSGNRQAAVTFTGAHEATTRTATNYDYSLDGGATWTTRTPASTASPLHLTGLTNGRTYQIRLRARNNAGVGPASGTVSATPTRPPTPGIIDTGNRAAVIDAYRTRMLPTFAATNPWLGNSATCQAGPVNPAYDAATLTAVNYFRGMAGVEPVTAAPELTPGARAAALMMAVNGRLSHGPTSDWKCFTEAGRTTAGVSSLALGLTGPNGVGLFMEDPGANNIGVGHRGSVLDPSLVTVGIGNVGGSLALDVGTAAHDPDRLTPARTTWPTAGYFPKELAKRLHRWHYTNNGRPGRNDNSAATVTVTGPGQVNIPVTVYRSPTPRYAYNGLVWDLPSAPVLPEGDVTYHVQVTDIRTLDNPGCNWQSHFCAYHSRSDSYDVTFVQARPATP